MVDYFHCGTTRFGHLLIFWRLRVGNNSSLLVGERPLALGSRWDEISPRRYLCWPAAQTSIPYRMMQVLGRDGKRRETWLAARFFS